ncbi:MAG: hypothetical protein ACI9CB_002071 [Rhodothermales bacterium]|jgi:hypothetical protein
MKHLLIIFMLSMALQPMQLQACPTEPDQVVHNHENMQSNAEHDCCDTNSDEATHACNDAMQCGSCSLGISLVSSGPGTELPDLSDRYLVFNSKQVKAPSPHLLFRPPIS